MPRAMTYKDFCRLSRRDFDNGATTDEIGEALRDRERLIHLLTKVVRNSPPLSYNIYQEVIPYLTEKV